MTTKIVNQEPKPRLELEPELEPESEYIINFDGCSKGNPGQGGSGAVLYHNSIEIWSDSKFTGAYVTNNVAEYTGLIMGMLEASSRNIEYILVKGDSQLIIRQMTGEYKVKSDNLILLYNEAKRLESKFKSVTYHHVYRNQNVRADKLSNDGLLKK